MKKGQIVPKHRHTIFIGLRITQKKEYEVWMSALHTGRLYPLGNIPVTHFCYRLSRPQGHSADGKIMSIKNSQ